MTTAGARRTAAWATAASAAGLITNSRENMGYRWCLWVLQGQLGSELLCGVFQV